MFSILTQMTADLEAGKSNDELTKYLTKTDGNTGQVCIHACGIGRTYREARYDGKPVFQGCDQL